MFLYVLVTFGAASRSQLVYMRIRNVNESTKELTHLPQPILSEVLGLVGPFYFTPTGQGNNYGSRVVFASHFFCKGQNAVRGFFRILPTSCQPYNFFIRDD